MIDGGAELGNLAGIQFPRMNPRPRFSSRLPILACGASILVFLILPSCASNENYAKRLEKRNSKFYDYNERRKLRLQARQERTDMWFDRVMGL